MITFVTSWYELKAKFDKKKYYGWMKNLLSNVVNFNLVIFSNRKSCKILEDLIKGNPRIKLIIKPIEQFYNYKYKKYWERNHQMNVLLKNRIDWELNMLWAEKIHFVAEVYKNKYFKTDYYGWCDIGYFRGRNNDIKTDLIKTWPSKKKELCLNKDKIYYAIVNRNVDYLEYVNKLINTKNEKKLPQTPVPPDQISIAGGFFLLHKKNIWWWKTTFDKKLELYFKNDYLVKDDQIIVADCCFSIDTRDRFALQREPKNQYDIWFMFQRLLL